MLLATFGGLVTSAMGWLLGDSPRRPEPAPPVQLHASYDAARSGVNAEHWRFADSLSADAAHSREVRHSLISRSRYESESNGYYSGAIQTHVVAVVGNGPRLRMQTSNSPLKNG